MSDIKVDGSRAMGTAGAADRMPGLVLGTLVPVGLGVGGGLVADTRPAALPVSIGASIVWLGGAAVVYPIQAYVADALWASGLPALVAVTTGALAWWAQRRDRPS